MSEELGGTALRDTTGHELRAFLARQTRAASEEAVRSGGQVAPQQVETLERLARLVALHEALQQAPSRHRWRLLLAFGTTLLIISALLFARVAETEIELDLVLSEVGFALPTPQKLTDVMVLSALGVSGLRGIQLPQARSTDAQVLVSGNAGAGLRLSVASEGGHQGSISLETLLVPTGTRVWVRNTGLPREYRLSLKSTGLELRAAVNGAVQVGFSGGGIQQLDFATPHAVLLQSGTNEVDLDVTFLDSAKSVFLPQLFTSNLSFAHIEEGSDANRTVARRVSTISSGTLYFESLNGEARKLRAREVIQLEDAQGEIRTLRLQGDHIDLEFHGRVRGLSVGLGDATRTLMPTWLDWLKARHGLSLFWGTALYLFGLIGSVLRWFGKSV